MFVRLVYESFRRQKRRKLLAGAAITLGVTVATAMIAVATDIGDARLIVADTGLVVPPQRPETLAAAIRTLAAESASLQAERGRRARERIVQNFSMGHAVQRHVELYESLAAKCQ